MSVPVNGDELRFRKAMRVPTAIGVILFVSLLWGFSFNPLHSGVSGEAFAGFFDDQAVALLDGHLDIEPGAADIEAFVVGGKEYLYYPPGPALLRIPITAFTDNFEGRLTAPSMLLAWFVLALTTTRLMWLTRGLMRPNAQLGRWETAMYGVLHVSLCAGSVVLFLAALPWVYHEVYIWSIALVLAAAVAMIRLAQNPTRRSVVVLGGLVLGAVLVRAPAGWGLAAGAFALASWMWRGGLGADGRRLAPWTVLAGIGPLAVGIAINWAKFQHPYLFPLEKQLFTSLSPRRRAAMAANGGDLVSLNILPTTVANYLRPDGIRFTQVFPFVSLPGKPAPSFGNAFVDQAYRTGSVTAFMPLLLALTVWGLVSMVHSVTRQATRLLRVPLAAAAIVAGPVMIYGYLAYRYTSEFVPILAIGSIIGVTALISRCATWARSRRLQVLAVISFVALFGIVANMGAAISAQHLSNPGPMLERYVRAQMLFSEFTGNPLADNIQRVDALPAHSVADQIVIIGECDGAFIGTGDNYAPWEPIAMREWFAELTIQEGVPDGSVIELGTVGSTERTRSTIAVEIIDGRFRTRITRPTDTLVGEWTPFAFGRAFEQRILVSTEYRVYSVEPAPEDDKVVAPFAVFDNDQNAPSLFVPADATVDGVDGVGVSMVPGPNNELCDDLLALIDGDAP